MEIPRCRQNEFSSDNDLNCNDCSVTTSFNSRAYHNSYPASPVYVEQVITGKMMLRSLNKLLQPQIIRYSWQHLVVSKLE